MKNIDVLLFIEHKDRELEITLAIAAQLREEFKLNVEIASLIFESYYAALRYTPKVVVTPSTAFGRGSASWIFYQIFGDRITYVNMNYEQFISSWKGKYKTPSHYMSVNRQKQFVWGEYFADVLNKGGISKENIFHTGRPLSAVVKVKYKDRKDDDRSEISKELGMLSNHKWHFVALTDGLAFATEEKIQSIIDNGAIEQGLRFHITQVKDTIEILIVWIDKYIKSAKCNDYFILRPHPSISVSQYEKLIISILGYIPDNIKISKKYSAYKWLSACDNYFTNYSTLSIDAQAMKKPLYIITPNGSHKGEDYWWCDHGEKLITFRDFSSAVTSSSDNPTVVKISSNNLINGSLDGVLESAKYINEFALNRYQVRSPHFASYLKPLIYNPRRVVGSLVRLLLSKHNKNIFNFVKPGIADDYLVSDDIGK